jgi:hypothetical protein
MAALKDGSMVDSTAVLMALQMAVRMAAWMAAWKDGSMAA